MILITGSTGLVGRHLMLALIREGKQVRALYRSEDKKKEVELFYAFAKAESFLKNIDWQQGDITDVPRLEIIFKEITKVYHCAALISFDPYKFKELTKVNIEGTANVVNLCIANKVQKLIHLSSIATLAKSPYNPITEENYWDPDAKNSVYALTKYGAEMEVWRGTQENLNALIFNPGIILGEGNYHSGSGIVFKRAFQEKKHIPKGGSAIIDVKDLVHLMIEGMKSNIVQQRYISTSKNLSHKDLAVSIATSLNKKPPRKAIPKWLFSIVVGIDWCIGIIVRKRSLTTVGSKSLQTTHNYDNTKLLKDFKPEFTSLEDTLTRITKHITYKKTSF